MHRLLVITVLSLMATHAIAAEEPAKPAPATTPAPAASDPTKNTLKWTTASEVSNFGYDVYRGDAEEGPFTRLTKKPIAGGGTTDMPSKYEYVDEGIDPTRTYWYYVESVSLDGQRERFTPIVKKGPKVGAGAAAPAGSAAAPTGSAAAPTGSAAAPTGKDAPKDDKAPAPPATQP